MTDKTYDELKAENEKLRHKLSPLEDPEFTRALALKLGPQSLLPYQQRFRKGDYIVISPADVAELCGLDRHNIRTVTNVARSLQAMCWERSAKGGNLLFVMPLQEYLESRQ